MKISTILLSVFAAVGLATSLTSCSQTDGTHNFALDQNAAIDSATIQRLDLTIEGFGGLDSASQKDILNQNRELLWGFGKFTQNADSITAELVAHWSAQPATEIFMPEVRNSFADLKAEEAAIGRILATARKNYLKLPVKNFATVTWGNQDKSIVIIDTIETAYIALNHYLGPNSNAYRGWPDYKRNIKSRAMIPVDMSEALVSTAYPYQPEGDATVLSRMLYEGAITMAKQAMNPQATPAQLFGYTDDVYNQVVEHENFIWKHLVDSKNNGGMLYSTDGEVMSNLFDFVPTSSRISPDAPGRAVRYIGYRIVVDYLKAKPQTTLAELLSPSFYSHGTEVLRISAYTPESKK